jgi:hypothetical protein
MTQTQQTKVEWITECLTNSCIDCPGSYINKLIGYKLECKCECHNKKILERQQVVGPERSNVHHNSRTNNPGDH